MRVAIIGAGGNATGHAQSLIAIDDVQIVGVADPMVDRARRLSKTAAALRTATIEPCSKARTQMPSGSAHLVSCTPLRRSTVQGLART